MELHKRRQTITEPECRYLIQQVALACAYLHRAQVIHRDLKLGNIFLNDAMKVKIGDFGLATKLDYDGERKLYASVLAYCSIKLFIMIIPNLCHLITSVNVWRNRLYSDGHLTLLCLIHFI